MKMVQLKDALIAPELPSKCSVHLSSINVVIQNVRLHQIILTRPDLLSGTLHQFHGKRLWDGKVCQWNRETCYALCIWTESGRFDSFWLKPIFNIPPWVLIEVMTREQTLVTVGSWKFFKFILMFFMIGWPRRDTPRTDPNDKQDDFR